MDFVVQFEMDNDAFVEDMRAETVRVLGEVSRRVEWGQDYGNVKDVNGNTIGRWSIGEHPED